MTQVEPEEYELVSAGEVKDNAENVRFAWRPLEVSNRLQDQTLQFLLFVDSPSFTPEFLTEFLVNYHRHALHILNNYSAQGNHLLFEAQRMVYAGAFFPEFKEAASWRESGISILNREIKSKFIRMEVSTSWTLIIIWQQSISFVKLCAWRMLTVSVRNFLLNM